MIDRLGWAQSRAQSFFDSTCTIKRAGVQIDGPNEDGTYGCAVESMVVGGQIEGEYTPSNSWRVSLAIGVDVQVGDYITERGRILQVQEVPSPESYEPYIDVICTRV